MIVNVNKNGKKIANVEVIRDEIYDDDWRLIEKNNVENVYIDMKQGKNGFTESLDIDLKTNEDIGEIIADFMDIQKECGRNTGYWELEEPQLSTMDYYKTMKEFANKYNVKYSVSEITQFNKSELDEINFTNNFNTINEDILLEEFDMTLYEFIDCIAFGIQEEIEEKLISIIKGE